MQLTATGLRVFGFAGRDFATGEPTATPTPIEYETVEAESLDVLLRHETHVDALTNANRETQLVCTGVTKLLVLSGGSTESLAMLPEPLPVQKEPVPIPDRLVIQLRCGMSPVFERLVLIR